MDVSNSEIVKATEHLLYDIHMGQHRQICNLCKNNIFWKYNHNCCKGIMDKRIIISINTIIRPSEVKEFEHIQYYINKLFYNYIIITGIYCIHKSEKTGVKKYYFDYIIVFSGGLASYIQIFGNNLPTKIHRVVSIRGSVYNMQESEILYIETMGGHVIWHCIDSVIETIDSLKNIEVKMSKDFIKVHRSYIINRNFVKSIQRCNITMINGDVIPVPYKKYVAVKNKLCGMKI